VFKYFIVSHKAYFSQLLYPSKTGIMPEEYGLTWNPVRLILQGRNWDWREIKKLAIWGRIIKFFT
jgi:hypothetical protein